MRILKYCLGFFSLILPVAAVAADGVYRAGAEQSVQNAGISGIWLLSNISYAGMRAQNHPSLGWRIISFLFGFPGTLISFLVVREGGERAYGVDISKNE